MSHESLIRDYPLATLFTPASGGTQVSHVPMLWEPREGTPGVLLGHLARGNPHWRALAEYPEALAIFHGPHAYITPKWYAAHDVPTWNYAVVHVHGRARLIEGYDELMALLRRMMARFEGSADFELPGDLREERQVTSAIVGFEIAIERIVPKFKLSQKRSLEDRLGVIRGLEEQGDEMSRAVARLMGRQDPV